MVFDSLLDEGANPYFPIVTRTATHEASWDGSVRIVQELVRRFPNLTKYPDGEGFLLIHRAARNELFLGLGLRLGLGLGIGLGLGLAFGLVSMF